MTNSKQSGTYTAPDTKFTISIPTGWTVRETDQNCELISPSGKSAIVLTTFRRTDVKVETDASEHLRRFLKGAEVKGKPRVLDSTKSHSSAEYVDSSNRFWRVEFLASPDRLVLATYNSDPDEDPAEKRNGLNALESIKI